MKRTEFRVSEWWTGFRDARTVNDLEALRDMIHEATHLLSIDPSKDCLMRAQELLNPALQLADRLMKMSAAAVGAKGGNQTTKRGPEYFRNIANLRWAKKGGRRPQM